MKSTYRVAVVVLAVGSHWLAPSAAAPGFGVDPYGEMHISGDPLYRNFAYDYNEPRADPGLGSSSDEKALNPPALRSSIPEPESGTSSLSSGSEYSAEPQSLSSTGTSSQSPSIWDNLKSGHDRASNFLSSEWQKTFGTPESPPTVTRTSVEARGKFGPMLQDVVAALPKDAQDFINEGWYSGHAAQQAINRVEQYFAKMHPNDEVHKCHLDNAKAILASIYDPKKDVVIGTNAPFSYNLLLFFLFATEKVFGPNGRQFVDGIMEEWNLDAQSALGQMPVILHAVEERLASTASLTPEMMLEAFTTFIETYILWEGATSGMEKKLSMPLYQGREDVDVDIFYDAHENAQVPGEAAAAVFSEIADEATLTLLNDSLDHMPKDLKDCDLVSRPSVSTLG